MRQSGIKPDSTTFLTALSAIRSNLSLQQGKCLHCLAEKSGCLSHVSSATSLFTMYANTGELGSSWFLFKSLPFKDLVAWNSMIAGLRRNGCYEEALDLFRQMQMDNVGIDSATLVIVLPALSHLRLLTLGMSIHGFSLRHALDSGFSVENALIDLYAKCRDLRSANTIFERLHFRETEAWNTMIWGCLHCQKSENSIGFFKKMVLSNAMPDSITLSVIISACHDLGNPNIGKSIHCWGFKRGFGNAHISMCNSLISFYSKINDIEYACKVFEGLVSRDLVSWNSTINAFIENERVSEAFGLLEEMESDGFKPDLVTVVILISHCSKSKLLEHGQFIHGFVIRRELGLDLTVINSLIDMYTKCSDIKSAMLLLERMDERDLITWNTMIAGYSDNGLSRDAVILFRDLLNSSQRCNLATLIGVLSCCDCLESLAFGRLIHSWEIKSGFSQNVAAQNATVFMYINCGDLESGLSVFEDISVQDVVSWNTVIVGCAQTGFCRKALETFDQMLLIPINPDPITLVSVSSACGELKLLNRGIWVHGYVLKIGLEFNLHLINALLSMYCKCKDIKSAELIFGSIPNQRNLCSWNSMISGYAQNKQPHKARELFYQMDFEPNEMTLASVLSACAQLGDFKLGEHIHDHITQNGFEQNAFVCTALIDMYAKCGRLEEAIQIFKDVRERSIVCLNAMIGAYGLHGYGREALSLFSEMLSLGVKPNESTFISVLRACSHSGLVDEGLAHFDLMFKGFGVSPSTEHYVCIVDSLSRAGRLKEACEFIKAIPREPKAGVWGALLSGCKDNGDLEIGRFAAERVFGLESENVGYYISLSNIYAAERRWGDVVEIRSRIKEKGLRKIAGFSVVDAW
ncbi:pentatricopeptide repeat-containing protein At4g19220, mitochondrial [Amborella trichopoda]|nr:pentatricopeptide repeat-containing protein At4g19220, mitochondrial [Amborella trichopoda]|eukprot:XP_006826788.2 pentatricopeptide repeat-containing protein At4g19220, mitochondrial [Amborella trichopoda]